MFIGKYFCGSVDLQDSFLSSAKRAAARALMFTRFRFDLVPGMLASMSNSANLKALQGSLSIDGKCDYLRAKACALQSLYKLCCHALSSVRSSRASCYRCLTITESFTNTSAGRWIEKAWLPC